jgi:hypothetical protein
LIRSDRKIQCEATLKPAPAQSKSPAHFAVACLEHLRQGLSATTEGTVL